MVGGIRVGGETIWLSPIVGLLKLERGGIVLVEEARGCGVDCGGLGAVLRA